MPAAAVAELRELPPPGAIGLVHGSLSGGFAHEPLGPAGPDRPRAVRRDPRPTPDPVQARRHPRPGRQAGARRPGRARRPRHRPLRRHDAARVRRRRQGVPAARLRRRGQDLPARRPDRPHHAATRVARGRPSASWAAPTGSAPSDGCAGRWPSWRRTCSRSTPPASRRPASASRPTPSGSASWRRRSRTARRRTSCAPSRRSRATCSAAGRWTGWCAATSATARPRSRCAPPSRRCRTASRWRCWCPPRCWRSSTWAPSSAGWRRSRSRSAMLSRFVPKRRAGEDRGGRRGRQRSTC